MKSATVTLSHSVFHCAFNQDVKLHLRIQWPTHGSGHPSNQPLQTHVSTISVPDSSSHSERWFFFQLFIILLRSQSI